MDRSTPGNNQIRAQLEADVSAWLAQGNEPTELPGFGLAPKISEVNGQRISMNTLGHVNKLDPYVENGIKQDLLAGRGTARTARQWRVGTATVTRCKDALKARGKI
jgi:hypothetical protein